LEPDFEEFLRVFLDIRLPFVAFGGSIMGILGGVAQIEPGPLVGQVRRPQSMRIRSWYDYPFAC
jgi:hypothetical protein